MVLYGIKLVGLQFGLLIAVSALFAALDLDRTIAGIFYDPGKGWFMGRHAIWMYLYQYGTIPGIILTLVCLILWLISFFQERLARWRPYLLLVVLTTAIACGLLVNGILKSYWGRPRPNQITEYGGYYQYRNVFPPGTAGKGASFPSGHSAMGFAFLSLVFLKKRSNRIAYAGLSAGLILGGLLSAARLVKGAHFPTDMLWSLGIVLMTATALYYIVLRIPVQPTNRAKPILARGLKVWLILLVGAAAVLIIGAAMTRRPFYKTTEFKIPVSAAVNLIAIRINAKPEALSVKAVDGNTARLLVHGQGMGWAWVDYDVKTDFQTQNRILTIVINIKAHSYFAELDHSIEVFLPSERRNNIKVQVLPMQNKP
jgi:lipid A 4'-phosphatase